MNKSDIFAYFYADKTTGRILWRERSPSEFCSRRAYKSWMTRFNGKEAGSKPKLRADGGIGSVQIHFRGKMLMAHRVMAVLCGILEEYNDDLVIDHIDGDSTNNKPGNLRAVTDSINSRNCKKEFKGSTSKITGVYFHKASGKWLAAIGTGQGSKGKCIGYYEDLFEAICARKSEEVRLGYTSRHGYKQ